jgi:hypothetical protein
MGTDDLRVNFYDALGLTLVTLLVELLVNSLKSMRMGPIFLSHSTPNKISKLPMSIENI